MTDCKTTIRIIILKISSFVKHALLEYVLLFSAREAYSDCIVRAFIRLSILADRVSVYLSLKLVWNPVNSKPRAFSHLYSRLAVMRTLGRISWWSFTVKCLNPFNPASAWTTERINSLANTQSLFVFPCIIYMWHTLNHPQLHSKISRSERQTSEPEFVDPNPIKTALRVWFSWRRGQLLTGYYSYRTQEHG